MHIPIYCCTCSRSVTGENANIKRRNRVARTPDAATIELIALLYDSLHAARDFSDLSLRAVGANRRFQLSAIGAAILNALDDHQTPKTRGSMRARAAMRRAPPAAPPKVLPLRRRLLFFPVRVGNRMYRTRVRASVDIWLSFCLQPLRPLNSSFFSGRRVAGTERSGPTVTWGNTAVVPWWRQSLWRWVVPTRAIALKPRLACRCASVRLFVLMPREDMCIQKNSSRRSPRLENPAISGTEPRDDFPQHATRTEETRALALFAAESRETFHARSKTGLPRPTR